jgi:hypothetical protein
MLSMELVGWFVGWFFFSLHGMHRGKHCYFWHGIIRTSVARDCLALKVMFHTSP